MTVLELQREFERLLQTSSKLYNLDEKPDTETIFGFLNLAQLRLVKQKYLPSSNTEDNILSIQNNMEDLKQLIVTTSLSASIITSYPYTMGIDFPNDYLHYIRSDSTASRTNDLNSKGVAPVSTTMPNKIISYTNMDKYLSNTFNKPIIRKPVVIFRGDELLVTHDVYTTITKIVLTYLRKPLPISIITNQTSELAEFLHEDIAALAVQIFEAQKYKLAGQAQPPTK